jgi:hypothetical protein
MLDNIGRGKPINSAATVRLSRLNLIVVSVLFTNCAPTDQH